MKSCADCKFFMTYDSGYSNYTVMETTACCLKNLNPHLPAEESYSWRRSKEVPRQLQVAETCPAYKEGEGAWFDVDGDVTVEDFKDDPELYEALLAYEETPT